MSRIQPSAKSRSRINQKFNAFKLLIILGCLHVCSSVAGVCGLNDNPEYATPEAACQAAAAHQSGGCTTTTFKSLIYLGLFDITPSYAIKYGTSDGRQYFCVSEVTSTCSGMTPFYEDMSTPVWCLDIKSKPSISLTPASNQTPPNPRPKGAEGKDGKSTLELIAKVMEGSTPKAGVVVTFKVDVVPMTGGHGHHDANRPKGSVPASGVTDANGEIKLTFKASEVAGSHNITATCDSCSNKTVDKKVDVRVPDLAPISPNPSQNADGSYQYAFTAVDPGHVGTSGGRQRGEYYLTAEAAKNLDVLISNFAEEGWGIVGLNDASLNWGGLYDLRNNWNTPHSEHRLGEEIDISFVRAGNVVSMAKQNSFYKKFCEDKKAEIPFSILHHYVLIPHFHIRLANANKCGRTAH